MSKIIKISLIVLGVPVLFFVGLVIYEITIGLPESSSKLSSIKPVSSEHVTKKAKPPKRTQLPSLPSTSEPVIVSVNFPKQVALNQKITAIMNFKDREGDVAKLIFQDLNTGATNKIDYSSKAAGKSSGSLTFSQISTMAQIVVKRLILVDEAGNQSSSYIFTYKAGDTGAYDRFDAEVLLNRPIERRKKIHFFILNNTENKTELANGSSFSSETDSIGTVSPAVAKVFETSVLPQINGIWDQCGVAFDLGMLKVVRPEKVNLPDGRTLDSLFGVLLETGEPFVITSSKSTNAPTGIKLIKTALPAFGIPTGDIAIFIEGPKFLNIDEEEKRLAGYAIKNLALVSWRYIHFLNETRGEIVIPKNIMKTFAHEIGHSLGLDHPGEGKAVPEDKFSKFNLMRQTKLGSEFGSELISEQCDIVNGQF